MLLVWNPAPCRIPSPKSTIDCFFPSGRCKNPMHTWIHSWKLLWNLKITQLQSGNSSEPNLHDFGFQPFIRTQDTCSMFLVPPSPSYGATSGSRSSSTTTDSGASQNIVVYYHPRPHWVGVALPFKKNGTIEQWRNNTCKQKKASPVVAAAQNRGVSRCQPFSAQSRLDLFAKDLRRLKKHRYYALDETDPPYAALELGDVCPAQWDAGGKPTGSCPWPGGRGSCFGCPPNRQVFLELKS